MELQGFVFDIESNGFLFQCNRVWTICFRDIQGDRKLKLNPFKDAKWKDKFLEWLDRYDKPLVVGHNILGFDMFVLRCVLGLEFRVGKEGKDWIEGREIQFIDTFYWSMFLNPDRLGHGIEAWGEVLGLPKIDWRAKAIEVGLIDANSPKGQEFMQHHPEMDIYCERDVDVNLKVFNALMVEHNKLYRGEFPPTSFRGGQKAFFLMSCQEYTGWPFDMEAAQKLKVRIAEMMEEIRAEVEPQLPPRALKKGEEKEYTMPAKPFKKNGDVSASWENFVKKHNGVKKESGKWEFYGKEYEVVAGAMLDIKMPMEMANQDQLKDWFLEEGWKPTFWNFKRGPDKKPMRDPKTRELIRTTPKIQEQQKICPNLSELNGEIPQKVVKWLSLRNRQSVLEGWMTNERLEYDGRIGAGRTAIASTHRQKHKVVVNVPKADPKVLLGYEMRELWIAEEGNVITACDAAALEGRVQGHYTYKYDNGATAEELLKGDVHTKNAFVFFEKNPIVRGLDRFAEGFNNKDPVFVPFRNKSKNGFYAAMYGCMGPKLASTLGLPESEGQGLLDKFWAANPGTKALKDALEEYWNVTGQKKYLPAIDGRMLITRKKSALLNTIFQSCGGISMDYACCFMDNWLGEVHFDEYRRPYYMFKGYKVSRIGYFHDEYEWMSEEGIAPTLRKMTEMAIVKAGEYLKLKVPLAGEAQTGNNWREIH
jgi:hypothetical protein